jgi:hypothetical protein
MATHGAAQKTPMVETTARRHSISIGQVRALPTSLATARLSSATQRKERRPLTNTTLPRFSAVTGSTFLHSRRSRTMP